ncbi:MAG: hypothetical protein RLZZ453_1016 [Chlamydiota bacterium]|jgi:tyrosine-specific transport protein
MHVFHSLGHLLGGTLLIAGTMVGVGMLALPVATGAGGFLPAIVVYILCWLFMLSTGLLLLEVCTWMPKDANLITMAHRLLGPVGRGVCWVVYLFLFVTVMIAHVVGGGTIFSEIFGSGTPNGLFMVLYVALFAPIIYLGTLWVDRLNILLMLGVISSYLLFIPVSYNQVNFEFLKRVDWSYTFQALPVLFTAFTFQVIIPTLMTYMKRDVKKIRLAIILGTSIPLVVYLIWEFLILGIVPADGPHSLAEAAEKGWNAVTPLKEILKDPLIFKVGKAFAFFTMTTSYIGLSLAYFDFLADGLKITKKGWHKLALCLIVFVPPTLIGMTYPDIFLTMLGYAGGFSCAILFGLFPPLMVWIGRYVKKETPHPQIPGGKIFLFALMLFVVVEVISQCKSTFF